MKNLVSVIISAVIPTAVALAAAPGSPASPKIKAEADPTGLFRVNITVTAPIETVDGTPLESLGKIELWRNGGIVKVFDSLQPGEERTYTDLSVSNGYAEYSAKAFIGAWESDASFADRVFVGVDTPLAPKNFRATATDNKITFYWAKGDNIGENGERVRPDGLTYLLESLNSSYEAVKTLSESKGQTYAYYCPVNSGKQDVARFGLRAYNTTGYSEYTYVRVITGAPYYFPFNESFAGGVSRSLCWQNGDGNFVIVNDESADDDFGSIACVPAHDGSTTSFNLGKICMANTESPLMTFRVKAIPEGETLTVKVARGDGAEAALLTVSGPIEEWTKFSIDLSSLKREPYIIPKFVLADSNTEPFYLDDIRFEDPYSDDLAVRVITPETAYGPTEIIAAVTNEGRNVADGAKIYIYTSGRQTDVLKLDKPLKPGETEELKATVNVEGEESVEVAARVSWVYDVNPVNDKACAQIIPVKSSQEVTAGTSEIMDESVLQDIMTLDGIRIPTPLSELPAGVYVINGRKTIIK